MIVSLVYSGWMIVFLSAVVCDREMSSHVELCDGERNPGLGRKLSMHGFALTADDACARLTNVRYADDLPFFAESFTEATEMLELLLEFLTVYGLEYTSAKTKTLSTSQSDFAGDIRFLGE